MSSESVRVVDSRIVSTIRALKDHPTNPDQKNTLNLRSLSSEKTSDDSTKDDKNNDKLKKITKIQENFRHNNTKNNTTILNRSIQKGTKISIDGSSNRPKPESQIDFRTIVNNNNTISNKNYNNNILVNTNNANNNIINFTGTNTFNNKLNLLSNKINNKRSTIIPPIDPNKISNNPLVNSTRFKSKSPNPFSSVAASLSPTFPVSSSISLSVPVSKTKSKYLQNLMSDASIKKFKQSCIHLLKTDKEIVKLYAECGYEKTNFSYENYINRNFFGTPLFMYKLEILFSNESNFLIKGFKEKFFRDEIIKNLNKTFIEQVYRQQMDTLKNCFDPVYEMIKKFDFCQDINQ